MSGETEVRVNGDDWLAQRFDASRSRLRAVAYRMLGSTSEADDAVQETWLKLTRSGSQDVLNLGGWLTTVLARVCLDMLRTRRSRGEDALEAAPEAPGEGSLEDELALTDAAGPALLVVLETLAPAERVAFVLHDLFDLSFDEIARVLERTPVATRQLASRARRRVRGAQAPPASLARHRELVAAFLAASRDGDFDRLLAVLSPDVVLRADQSAVNMAARRQEHGAPALAAEVRGATEVAQVFKGRAQGAVPRLIDGEPGAVWAAGGQIRAAFLFTLRGGQISALDIVTEPTDLAEFDVRIE